MEHGVRQSRHERVLVLHVGAQDAARELHRIFAQHVSGHVNPTELTWLGIAK